MSPAIQGNITSRESSEPAASSDQASEENGRAQSPKESTPPPAPKVKLSLRDFAMRRKKQLKEDAAKALPALVELPACRRGATRGGEYSPGSSEGNRDDYFTQDEVTRTGGNYVYPSGRAVCSYSRGGRTSSQRNQRCGQWSWGSSFVC
jgi:hypothetical protein